MNNYRKMNKKYVYICLLVIIGIISYFCLSEPLSSTSFHQTSINILDDKKMTVTGLLGGMATVSTAITLIPGDVAMPIANQISSASNYLLIVLCVIVCEKYLLTLSGFVTFSIIIPFSCVLGILYLLFNKEYLKVLALKLGVFGVALFLLVPTSVKLTNIIENTYHDSISETLDIAQKGKVDEDNEGEKSEWNFISNFLSSVENEASKKLEQAKEALSGYIDAIAVLVVTSCVIPILVLFSFILIVKLIFNVDINVTSKLFHSKSKKIITSDINE